MTDQEQRECNCGAVRFGPAAAHLPECYVMLAADAEAVQGVPVRDLSTSGRKRTQVEPTAPEDAEYTNITFIPNMRAVEVDGYHASGLPTIIRAGTLTGELLDRRSIEGKNGLMWFADIKLESDEPTLNGVEASFIAGTILKQLLDKVSLGSIIEVTRKPDGGSNGKLHMYEVYVLD